MVSLGTRWPTIPEPEQDAGSILASVLQLKMSMEMLTGQRGVDPTYSVDYNRTILSKTLDGLSAVVSENKRVAVNADEALAERTTLVEAEIVAARAGEPNLSARIVSVDTASVSRDGALATSISSVLARVNDVSAGGFFKTSAAVVGGGALASMDAFVYTSNAFSTLTTAGWRVEVTGGVGYFCIYTSNFKLIDNANVAKTVMFYTAGKFQFTADIAIDGNLTINGTINTPAVAANAVSQGAGATSGAASTSVGINVRAGATILVIATFNGAPGSYFPLIVSIGTNDIVRDATVIASVGNNYEASGSGGSAGIAFLQTTSLAIDVPGAGFHTYSIVNNNGGGVGGVTIAALELAR